MGLPLSGARGEQHARQPGGGATEHVHADLVAGDVDAREASGHGVAADGVDGPAEVGVLHDDVETMATTMKTTKRMGMPVQPRPPELGDGQLGEQTTGGQPREVGLRHDADGLAVRSQQEGQAGERSQRAQRGDDGVHVELGHDEAVDDTQAHAGEDAHEDARCIEPWTKGSGISKPPGGPPHP